MGPGDSRSALDIGSGNGRDALFIAEAGFLVSAVDSSESAPVLDHPRVTQLGADIVEYPLQQYALINASLLLPFIDAARFNALWQKLLEALAPSGVIAGHLSGVRDWKVQAGHAWGCNLVEAKQLFSGLTIVSIEEHELDGPNISRVLVHKHNFEFVARK
jgi:SAM-dependent methyltransferase